MKKILSLGLIIVMAILFVGCQKEDPEEATKEFLNQLKAANGYDFGILVSGEALEDPSEEEKASVEAMEKTTQFKMLKEFDYEILDVKESKDNKSATVDVLIKTYNFAEVYKLYSGETMAKQEQWLQEGLSEEDIEKNMVELLDQKLKEAEKTYQDTVTLTLFKDGDNWRVHPPGNDEKFLDTLYGGLMTYIESLEQGAEDFAKEQ